MKHICIVALLLASFGVSAEQKAVLDPCRTGEGILNLYAGKNDFSGISKDIVLKSKAAVLIDNGSPQTENDSRQALSPFSIRTTDGKEVQLSGSDIPFEECSKMEQACRNHKDGKRIQAETFCIPYKSKVFVRIL